MITVVIYRIASSLRLAQDLPLLATEIALACLLVIVLELRVVQMECLLAVTRATQSGRVDSGRTILREEVSS